MENEIWKDIPEYEGLYQVSSLGAVRRLDSIIRRKRLNGPYFDWKWKGRIMVGNINPSGYRYVLLSKNGNSRVKYVHTLVATLFISEKSNEFLEINHKDGNKLNNAASNLEWCTRLENMRHAIGMGLIPPSPSGQESTCYKGDILVLDKKLNIVEVIKGRRDAVNKGFRPEHICACLKGRNKTHKGYTFQRVA